MAYLKRDEIKEKLESQFAEIISGGLSEYFADQIIYGDDDVCECVEPNSPNYQMAREMQREFMNLNF